MRLCGGLHTLVGRDGIQKDFEGLGGWAHVNLTKFNEAKCKVLHRVRAVPSKNTGWRE